MEAQFYIFNSLSMTHRDLTSDLKDICGLSASGYRVLLLISESENSIRATEIADSLGFKFTSVAAAVETLVKRGLVERSDDPLDKRASQLTITEAGDDVLSLIDETLLDRLKVRWAPLNKKQLEVILIDLEKAHLTSDYVTSIEIPYQDSEAIMRKNALSYTQFLILFLLELRGSQRPRDIAKNLDQKPATISVAMNGLEEKGLIDRSRSRETRSIMNITITEKGRLTFLETFSDATAALNSRVLRIYTEQEQKELDIISKLVVDAATREK